MTLDPWWLAGRVSPDNCVVAYQSIGAPSLEASYINLANPDQGTYNARPGVAPTFDASTGWTFNGTTQYLNTNSPALSLSWSMIVRFSNYNYTSASYLIGGYIPSGYPRSYLGVLSGGVIYANGPYKLVAPAISEGVIAFAKNMGFRNGVFDTVIDVDVPGYIALTIPCYVGCLNVGGTPNYFSSVKIQAVAIYNLTLTDDQIAAITNAMNALTGASLPTYQIPSAGMRRWAKLYSQQVGTAFIPAWARNSNRIITPGVMLP